MGETNISVNVSMLVLYSQLLELKVCNSIRFKSKHIQRIRLRMTEKVISSQSWVGKVIKLTENILVKTSLLVRMID